MCVCMCVSVCESECVCVCVSSSLYIINTLHLFSILCIYINNYIHKCSYVAQW